MLILSGSFISTMESHVLNYSSPLYGRRTGQIRLKQIPFSEYRAFFDGRKRNYIAFYAASGGVPRYILEIVDYTDVMKAVADNVLNPNSFLYEEPIFLLESELKEMGHISP